MFCLYYSFFKHKFSLTYNTFRDIIYTSNNKGVCEMERCYSVDCLDDIFIKLFQVNHLGLDMMELIESKKKYDFICDKIKNEYTAQGFYKEIKNYYRFDECVAMIEEVYLPEVIVSDPDVGQIVRKITNHIFYISQGVVEAYINLLDTEKYDDEYFEMVVSGGYENLSSFREIYGQDSNQMLAELIFEYENDC